MLRKRKKRKADYEYVHKQQYKNIEKKKVSKSGKSGKCYGCDHVGCVKMGK